MKKLKQLKNYLYLLPALLFLFLFTVYPIFKSVYLSFFETDSIFSFMDFVGLKNYRDMFEDKTFWLVLKNTFVFAFLQVILSTLLGFLFALLANNKDVKTKGLLRVAVFYPYICPWSVVSMVWMYLLHPTRGMINAIFNTRIDWLNNYQLTLFVLILITVWKTVGFNLLLFLSGMQGIPKELYEAYSLESTSSFNAVRYITIPLLGPTTFVSVLLSIVGAFQSVDIIYIITQGRPGDSTNTLVYYIYQKGIASWNVGYASALSTLLVAILLIFTAVYIKYGEKLVKYDE